MRPLVFAKNRAIFNNVLVGGQENVEGISQGDLQITANSRGSFISDNDQTWCPFGKFETPIGQSWQGNDDKVRARLVLTIDQASNKWNSLNSFAETAEKVSNLNVE